MTAPILPAGRPDDGAAPSWMADIDTDRETAVSTALPATGRHEAMIEAAVSLARLGFARIGWAPVGDGKAPTRRWKSDATDDPALVVKLLHGARNSLVIPKDRAVIIDIDAAAAWVELEAAGLPPTFVIDSPTPDHGHVYGLVPPDIDMATIPGTFEHGEIRRFDPTTGTASMVLGPWSLRSDGIYTPRDGVRAIAWLPLGVVDYLIASARHQSVERSAARGPADTGWTIANGRHDYLVGRARWLRGNGLTGERLVDELLRLDRDRCDPPLADVPGRGEAEVRLIADWTNGKIGDDPPPITITGTTPEPDTWAETEAEAEPERGASVITSLADFLSEVDVATLDVVPGIIPADALILWIGPKESFKSMAAATLHGAVATAGEWMGRPVLPMRSVYVSNEKRRRSVRERFRAIVGARAVVHDVGIVHRQGLTMDTGNPKWCRFVDEIEAMGERVLVTLDTLTSLAPPGFKENAPEAMGGVLAAVRMLTSLPIPASVNLLHHPAWADLGGKEMRSRGHSSLDGEHDGQMAFHRPDRAKDEGVIHVRPKDGDYQLLPFTWDRASMLILSRDTIGLPLTTDTALEIVNVLGGSATAADVRLALGNDRVSDRPRFSDDRVMAVLNQCEAAGDLTSSRASRHSRKVFSTSKEDQR